MQNNTDNLGHQTIKNSVYSFFSLVWPILLSLVLTPIIMYKLGVANYGIYLVINVFIGFISLLDFGLIPTLVKTIAFYFEKKEENKLFKIINSALSIYLGLGLIVSLFIFLGRYLFFHFLNIEVSPARLSLLIFLVALTFTINGFRSVVASILNGLQRYDLSAKIMMLNVVWVNALMLIFVFNGGGYVSLIVAQLLSVVFLMFGYYYYAHKLLPAWRPRFGFSKTLVMPELRFGAFVFLNQVSSTVLLQLDKLLLSMLLGPAFVPYYSLPGTVAQKTQDVSSSISGVLFPMATTLHAADDANRFGLIYRRVIYITTSIMAGLAFTFILYAREIMQYWLGGDFAVKSSSILVILTITYLFLSFFLPISNFLLGRGNSKELALFNMFIALFGVIMFIALVPIFGLKGAAWAYLVSVLPIPVFVLYIEAKIFKLKGSYSFYFKLIGRLAICWLISYALCFVTINLISNLFTLLFFMGLSLAVFALVYYFFGFLDKEDERLFKSYIRKFLHVS